MTDATTVRCPSGLVVAPRKLKVRQLKLLSDRRMVKTKQVYEEFLNAGASEVVDRGPYPEGGSFDWRRALTGDRFRAMIGVRCATHGSKFDFDVKCDECGEIIKWTVDLDELPTIDYPQTTLDAWLARKPLTLTVGGKLASYKVSTGEEEQRIRQGLEKLKEGGPGRKPGPGDIMVDSLFLRLSVDGVEKRDLRDWLEDLDGDELGRIQSAMDAASGGVETVVVVQCNELGCGARVRAEIPFNGGSYWLPRGTETTTPTPDASE